MRLPPAIRHYLSLPFRNVPIRIRAGPNRGRKWSIAASGRGVRSGRYEIDRFEAFGALLRSDDVLWDVGAHYGYTALVAASVLARSPRAGGRIYAFEPSTHNLWYLRKHLSWNGLRETVEVLPLAVADYVGTSRFGGSGSSVSMALGKGSELVRVSTMSQLLSEGLRFPTFMKIDVEGAEARVLDGAREVLMRAVAEGRLPLILVSVHSSSAYADSLKTLRACGYESIIASRNLENFEGVEGTWNEDPDLLACPPGRDVSAVSGRPWFSSRVH